MLCIPNCNSLMSVQFAPKADHHSIHDITQHILFLLHFFFSSIILLWTTNAASRLWASIFNESSLPEWMSREACADYSQEDTYHKNSHSQYSNTAPHSTAMQQPSHWQCENSKFFLLSTRQFSIHLCCREPIWMCGSYKVPQFDPTSPTLPYYRRVVISCYPATCTARRLQQGKNWLLGTLKKFCFDDATSWTLAFASEVIGFIVTEVRGFFRLRERERPQIGFHCRTES